MAQRWRYVRNGQELGPVTTADLRLLADTKRLQETDLVCADGSTKWVPAGSVKGLFYLGEGQRPGSGGGALRWIVAAAVIVLLAAVGVLFAGYYYLHWFGTAPVAVAPPSTNPPDPPIKEGGTTSDPGGPGGASSPPRKHNHHNERYLWRSSEGTFDNTDGENWIETYEGKKFSYVEQKRNEKFVELVDSSRPFAVRLFDAYYEVQVKKGVWERRLNGHWETPDG